MTLYFCMDDFIDRDNMIRWIDLIVDELVKKSPNKYRAKGDKSTGRPAYSAETMLKLYIYGCLNRIKSSRCLEKECHRNVEMMWLTRNQKPDHKTIANFRKDNKNLLKEFSISLKRLIKEMMLSENTKVATDGTKLKANACREMLSKKEIKKDLERLKEELGLYTQELDSQDKIEDGNLKEKNEELIEKVKDLNGQIEHLKGEIELMEKNNVNYVSKTDPDCRHMRGRYGNYPGYNVQFTTETEQHFILGNDVTQDANDLNQLQPAQTRLEEELDLTPAVHIADKGYCNLDVIEELEKKGKTEYYTPVPAEQGRGRGITFYYDRDYDKYICSQGRDLVLKIKNKPAKKSLVNIYIGNSCNSCPIREECTKSKRGRHISRFINQEFRDKFREKSESETGKKMSMTRKCTIEHIMATLKLWCGYIPILTRGLDSVQAEINIFTISWNIHRLRKTMSFSDFREKLSAIMALKSFYLRIMNMFLRHKCSRIDFKTNFDLIFVF